LLASLARSKSNTDLGNFHLARINDPIRKLLESVGSYKLVDMERTIADRVFKILDNTRAHENREKDDTLKLPSDALLDEQGAVLKYMERRPSR
jgi:hypothetical protein